MKLKIYIQHLNYQYIKRSALHWYYLVGSCDGWFDFATILLLVVRWPGIHCVVICQ